MIRVLRSELFKFRTTPGPWVVLAVTLVLSALGIVAAFVNPGFGVSFGAPHSVGRLRELVGAGYGAVGIVGPLIGILCVTGEYRHKVITTSLLVTPRREVLLFAKALASGIWGIVLCVASFVLVAVMGVPLLVSEGGSVDALVRQIPPVAPGLIGAFALLAVFGVGVGALVKNQIAAVVLAIGLSLVLEPVLVELLYHFFHIELNWLPNQDAAALAGGLTRGGQNGPSVVPNELLSWWAGGLALVAWGVGTALLGYFTTFRRDVT